MHSYRRHRRKKTLNRRILLLRRMLMILLAFVLVFSVTRLAIYLVKSVKTSRVNAELQDMYESAALETNTDAESVSTGSEDDIASMMAISVPEPITETKTVSDISEQMGYQYIGSSVSDAAAELYNINPDLIGWLKISGVVNLPVVYRDNEYYLTHDFYGKKSNSGTLFVDVSHPFQSDTRYLLIHGHAMHDGSMLGMITHYRNASYIAEHPRLTLNTLYSTDEYEVIGSCYLTTDEMYTVAGLGNPTFDSNEDFEAFIDNLRSHALHFTKEEIPSDSVLLALSTCYKDGRIVVYFRRISSVPNTDL